MWQSFASPACTWVTVDGSMHLEWAKELLLCTALLLCGAYSTGGCNRL